MSQVHALAALLRRKGALYQLDRRTVLRQSQYVYCGDGGSLAPARNHIAFN
jgi:hypothetical protein